MPADSQRDLAAVRSDYPLLKDKIYLNTAAMQPIPRVVRKRMAYDLADMALQDPNLVGGFPPSSHLREHYARLMGCAPADVGFTMNVTDGLLKAVAAMDLKKGEEVLVGGREFPSLTYLARSLQYRGIKVRWIKGSGSCEDDLTDEDLLEHADGCSLVLFSWVHYLTGRRLDLNTLPAALKAKGVRAVVVDGMQGLGPCFPDLQNTDVDAFAFNSVKWVGGPAGAGGVYLSPSFRGQMLTPLSGWLASARNDLVDLHRHDLDFWPDARRLETGSPPLIVHRAVEAYLDWFFQLGESWIRDRSMALAGRLYDRLREEGFSPITPEDPKQRAAIVSVPLDDAERLTEVLTGRGILLALRNGLLRFSPYFFNSEEDLEQAVAALKDTRG